jgi:PAS domain S-box-containing protein
MLFVLAVGMFYCFNFEATFESQALLTTLNILFCTSASLFIVYLAARSYLVTGSRAVLCLGCGALCIAITYLLAGVLLTDLNAALIVHNAGVCLAGALFICSAYWAFMRKPGKTAPAKAPLYLGCIYFTVLLIIGFLTSGAMTGVIPAFNLPGQGFTLLRQAVLGVTVIEFILASMCFGILYRQSRTPFLLWYCLGLLLFGLGMGTLILEGNPGTPLSWVGRGGQYLGGLYMLIAILSLTETGGDWRMPLEKALHESEEKYRTIVETAGEGIWMSDIEGRTTFVNKRMAEMIGYTPDEMMGKSAYDFMDEGARALARINLERRKQGLRDHFEQKYVRKDGATLWAIVSSTPLLDKDGRVIAFMGMLTDITERKRSEEALWVSEEKYRNIVETANEGIIMADTAGRIEYTNAKMARMLGYTIEELVGKPGLILVDPSELNKSLNRVEKRKVGEKEEYDIKFRRKDGSEMWVHASGSPVYDIRGVHIGNLAMYVDITERKQAEEALRESQSRMEAVFAAIPDVIVEHDASGTIVRANEAALKVAGFSSLSFTNKLAIKTLNFRSLDGSVLTLDKYPTPRALRGEIITNELYMITTVDGRDRVIATYAVPLYKDGKVNGVVGLWHDITELKLAEKDLRETRDYLESLINYANAPIIVWDPGFTITRFNHAFEWLSGYAASEVLGKSLSVLFPPDSIDESLSKIGKTLTGEYWDSVEIPILHKDGSIRIALWNSANINGTDNALVATIAQGQDITERKRIEAVIKQSEAQFRALIQNLESGIALVDDRGRFAVVNPAFLKMFGLANELDILNVNSQDWGRWTVCGEDGSLLHVDDHPVRKAAMTGKPVKNQLVGVRNPGANGLTWMLISAEPVLKDDGSINMIICTYHDITERKQIEKERELLLTQVLERTSQLQLANEELGVKSEEISAQAEELQSQNEELLTNNEELRAITESLGEIRDYLDSLISYANAPIIVWDPVSTITRFNGAFERLSGYAASEVIGKDLSILFPAERRLEAFDKIRLTLAGEFWESVEIPIQHKDGSIRIALWNSANIYGHDKKLLATIAQGQDITERKRVESELSEAKAQAELYLDLMGHDISNMHQIILMHLEMAEDILNTRGTLESEDKELIDVSVKTLEKAARLVDNVRKLQKIKSGEYGREAVDLAKVLEETLKVYINIPGRDVTIKYTPVYGNLVQANPLLKDVFSNLVDNAVKHSSGPLELGVDVSRVGRNGSSYYRVVIEDNGNGIHDNKKDEVFQRFKRGQTKAKGTGLGLYLVKSLVEGFGGYVEVQNRVIGDYTKGTRFLVYLPVMGEKNA